MESNKTASASEEGSIAHAQARNVLYINDDFQFRKEDFLIPSHYNDTIVSIFFSVWFCLYYNLCMTHSHTS